MVHKYKSFPVGKAGQRKLKKQILQEGNDESRQTAETPIPVGNADLGMKLAHMSFLNILGNDAHSQVTKKGGRRTRIDPLSLKKLSDSLLRKIEKKAIENSNQASSSEDEVSYVSEDNSY